jgi:FG-GAP-like repeat/Divergent InlB B-repeat domain
MSASNSVVSWANTLLFKCHHFFILYLGLGFFIAPVMVAAQSVPITAFYFRSTPGEYIGQGMTKQYSGIMSSITRSNQLGGAFFTIAQGNVSQGGDNWNLSLYPAVDQRTSSTPKFAVGAYEGAESVSFQGVLPGLSLSGNGRGCGYSTGRFSVLEVTYDANGLVTSFAANFVQTCATAIEPLFGEIRYNSSIPLSSEAAANDASPDPFALIMQSPVDAGSFVMSVPTTAYGINIPTAISVINGSYSINDGVFVTVAGLVNNGDKIRVRAIASSLAGGLVSPALTIGDKTVSATIKTVAPFVRLTGVRLQSSVGDPINTGILNIFLAPHDAIISSAIYSNAIKIDMGGRGGGQQTLFIAAANAEPLTVGTYEGAAQFPTNGNVPGLNLTGRGVGCGQVAGRFVIRELTRLQDGSIDRLAVDFEQRCEITKPPLFGEVRINSDVPFTSLPANPRAGVVITKAGRGLGTVSTPGGELSCGLVCFNYFPIGEVVTLNVVPAQGSIFKGWTDPVYTCSGTATCSFKADGGRVFTAKFEVPTRLTIQKTGAGRGRVRSQYNPNIDSISCDGDLCNYDYDLDTVISLEASASEGSRFVGWSGSGCTGTGACVVTLSSAKSVTANFELPQFTLRIVKAGAGSGAVNSLPSGIDCGADCTEAYLSGTGIVLTAKPDKGSIFAGWDVFSFDGTAHIQFSSDTTVTATFIPAFYKRLDMNDDGKSDLIFRNTTTGQISAWLMNGSTASLTNGLVPPGNWTVTHTADFNGDGKADILFRNDDGSVTLWLMNGLGVAGSVGLLGPNPDWRVSHVADFNGDGRADILWRNTNGAVTLWLMDGTTILSSIGLLGADPNWSVSHVADFNGDGKADLLWRNINGAVTLWLMNGTSILSTAGLLGADANWRVSHVADFDGDGKADLLWRNTNGAVTAWLMNGTTIASTAGLLGPDANWSVSHTGDFNGDGKADLLWRNTNGAVTQWLMNGTSIMSTAGLLGPDPSWRVTHLGDYNGDGKSDLVWRNTSNGAITMWLMNGAVTLSAAGILGATTWGVVPSAP